MDPEGYGTEWSTPNLLSPLEALEHFEAYKDAPPPMPTQFPGWNNACYGIGQRKGIGMGWYIVVGGDTGAGKSLLALQLACQSLKAGYRPGFVSLEMSIEELRTRFWAIMLGVEARRLEPGDTYDPETSDEVVKKLDRLNDKHPDALFRAVDNMSPRIEDVIQIMRLWHENDGVEVFVVDYLQLCESPDHVGIAREVQAISAAVREFAHRHRVIVIGLSQYNNEGGNNRLVKPSVGHLYGGRRLAQDATQVVLLDHSRYERDAMHQYLARTWLLLAKNRHGPLGEIPVEWDYRSLTTREAMPDEVSLWPEQENRR